MRHPLLVVYLHLVWTTWDREPTILSHMERRIHRCIEAEVRSKGCGVLAIGGMADHVHILLKLASTIAIADLLKQMKGVSSHFVNDVFKPNVPFRWQGGYAAFSVSPWDVGNVKEYVSHQKAHHNGNTMIPALEEVWEEIGHDGMPRTGGRQWV